MMKLFYSLLLCFLSLCLCTESIAKNKCLTELNKHHHNVGLYLENCNLNDNDVAQLMLELVHFPCTFLKPCVSILHLKHNNIGPTGAFYIASSPKINTLDISENPIGVEGVRYLAADVYLSALHINNLHLGDAMAKPLKYNLNIGYLTAEGNDFTAAAMNDLIKMPRLTMLSLNHNHIGDEGMAILAAHSFSILSVEDNNIGPEGAKAFTNYKSDLWLTLSHNHIGDVGISSLARGEFGILEAADNGITAKGAIALAKNSSIHVLELAENNIGDDGVAALARLPFLHDLGLRRNNLTDRGAIAIAQNQGPLFDRLDVSYNHIGHLGLQALYDARVWNIFAEGNDG